MSPVAAVCPLHGPFESRGYIGVAAVGNTYKGNTETCPECGTPSPLMEGKYNFDQDGFATQISGPEWSRIALATVQGKLVALQSKLHDPAVPDAAAEEWYRRTIDELRVENATLTAILIGDGKRKSRKKTTYLVAGVIALVAVLSDLPDAYEGIELILEKAPRAVEWFADQASAGKNISIKDYPLLPDEQEGQPG